MRNRENIGNAGKEGRMVRWVAGRERDSERCREGDLLMECVLQVVLTQHDCIPQPSGGPWDEAAIKYVKEWERNMTQAMHLAVNKDSGEKITFDCVCARACVSWEFLNVCVCVFVGPRVRCAIRWNECMSEA